jgi:hypothetical protein
MDVDPPNPRTLPSDLVVLNVSGTPITTAKSTLQTSPYFSSLMERWEQGMETLPDGSIFIDADPAVFRIILNYMRRPTVYPFLWTRERGFDHVLYSKVMAEADFFMLEDLQDWIRKERYRDAVEVRLEMQMRGARQDQWQYPRYDANEPQGTQEGNVNEMSAEHVELVKFELLDVPARGEFICPSGRGHRYFHDCNEEECFLFTEEDPGFRLQYEVVPKTLVCIWRITKVDMSVCYKS